MHFKRFALIGVLIVILATLAGVVSAQDEGQSGRLPSRFASDLARDLMNLVVESTDLEPTDIIQQMRGGSTLAEVITANGGDVEGVITQAVALITDRVNTAVSEGHMTQERADRILENIEEHVTDAVNGTLPLLQRPGIQNRPGIGRDHRILGAVQGALVEATGLEPAEIAEQLRAGASVADMLAANGVDVEIFVNDATAQIETRLDRAVENGRITQEQADERLTNLREHLTDLLNGRRDDTDI